MSDALSQFSNDDGHHLYWAGVPDPYGENFTVVFAYAANDNMARDYLLKNHDSVEDLSMLTQEHLSWGQIVLAGLHWSLDQVQPVLLDTFLKAYKEAGRQPPTALLMHAAHTGHVGMFDIVRPYYTFAFLSKDDKSHLAACVGQGGCVDTLNRVEKYFLPIHFECAMERASMNGHQHMVNFLATKCSAQKVLNYMIHENMHPHCYLPVQNAVNEQLNQQLMDTINHECQTSINTDTSHATRNRRKI